MNLVEKTYASAASRQPRFESLNTPRFTPFLGAEPSDPKSKNLWAFGPEECELAKRKVDNSLSPHYRLSSENGEATLTIAPPRNQAIKESEINKFRNLSCVVIESGTILEPLYLRSHEILKTLVIETDVNITSDILVAPNGLLVVEINSPQITESQDKIREIAQILPGIFSANIALTLIIPELAIDKEDTISLNELSLGELLVRLLLCQKFGSNNRDQATNHYKYTIRYLRYIRDKLKTTPASQELIDYLKIARSDINAKNIHRKYNITEIPEFQKWLVEQKLVKDSPEDPILSLPELSGGSQEAASEPEKAGGV